MSANEDLAKIRYEGFVRARRNLILIAVALFGMQMLKASGNEMTLSQLNLFGNVATLKDKTSIEPALWVFWGYLIWRCYVAWRGLLSYQVPSEWKTSKMRAAAHLAAEFVRENPTSETPGAKFASLVEITEKPRTTRVIFQYTYNGAKGVERLSSTCDIKGWQFWRMRFIALTLLVFDTPAVGEELLPFAIGLAPLGLQIFHWFR